MGSLHRLKCRDPLLKKKVGDPSSARDKIWVFSASFFLLAIAKASSPLLLANRRRRRLFLCRCGLRASCTSRHRRRGWPVAAERSVRRRRRGDHCSDLVALRSHLGDFFACSLCSILVINLDAAVQTCSMSFRLIHPNSVRFYYRPKSVWFCSKFGCCRAV